MEMSRTMAGRGGVQDEQGGQVDQKFKFWTFTWRQSPWSLINMICSGEKSSLELEFWDLSGNK